MNVRGSIVESGRTHSASPADAGAFGVVVIGRNEGERLRRCLDSVPPGAPVVYVDSGSTDGSSAHARKCGVDVVELDMSLAFTAARARDEGFHRLLTARPDLEFVQFVDGDCELAPGWIQSGLAAMTGDPALAAVCGRLRERFRDASIYNRLCDLEWDTPTGEVAACGGIALMRTTAFRAAGGFDPEVVAGEEPELCFRLRQLGHRIAKIADDMATHDAAMERFGQWWRRSMRSGYGYALLAAKHRGMWYHERRSIAMWGLVLPGLALVGAPATGGLSLALFLGYPILWLRIFTRRRRRRGAVGDSALYATFCVAGKVPEAIGMAKFACARARRLGPRIIEYK